MREVDGELAADAGEGGGGGGGKGGGKVVRGGVGGEVGSGGDQDVGDCHHLVLE